MENSDSCFTVSDNLCILGLGEMLRDFMSEHYYGGSSKPSTIDSWEKVSNSQINVPLDICRTSRITFDIDQFIEV
jgi:hypothetical protein